MFWVELLAHGCDAAACDGLLAAGAQGAAPLVVVRLAVGLAVMIKEATIDEWRETLLEKKKKSKINQKKWQNSLHWVEKGVQMHCW